MPADGDDAQNGDSAAGRHDVKVCLTAPSPPPPPPPPSRPFSNSSLKTSLRQKANALSPQQEVADACKRFLGSELDSSYLIACYKETQAVLQDGPMCGLVALEMAAQHLCPDTIPTTSEIYEEARKLNFTLQGEMFSAECMGLLARKLLKCEATVDSRGMLLSDTVDALLKGLPVLVPYDADCNHEPCCKKGHKAHWAVLTGVVLLSRGIEMPCNLNAYLQDTQVPNLYYSSSDSDNTTLRWMCDVCEVYVLAKQGKSTRLGLWSFGDLAASNANLIEVDPNRSREEHDYVIPEGGIEQGLCRKVIYLKKS